MICSFAQAKQPRQAQQPPPPTTWKRRYHRKQRYKQNDTPNQQFRSPPRAPSAFGPPSFTLRCGASELCEGTLASIWAFFSVPDLLTLLRLSRTCSRDAMRKLMTLERLAELWGGCPTVHSVLHESKNCQSAYATVIGRDTPMRGRKAMIFGSRGDRIMADSMRVLLQELLGLPEKHILLRFFEPSSATNFGLCDVQRTAAEPGVDHYVFRCRSPAADQDVALRLSVRRGDRASAGWQPSCAGRLLGSAPWRLGNPIGFWEDNLFAKGARVKIRRPLLRSAPTRARDKGRHGKVVCRNLQGQYRVLFDGEDAQLEWWGDEDELMPAAEPFADPLFRAIEACDMSALDRAFTSRGSEDLLEYLTYAMEANPGLEQFQQSLFTRMAASLALKCDVLEGALARMVSDRAAEMI
mmetsp:Transcript_60198/g.169792  ORF Transcript_60198/g.169792 Transcript_60198/m.169792 type:complete len:410 (-) Transcript_60198:418-1647(-)